MVEAFRTFTVEAHLLILQASEQSSKSPADQGLCRCVELLQKFVENARPLVTQSARKYLDWFEPHARRIRALPKIPDLVAIAGYTHVENSYTRLIAWALGKNNTSVIPQHLKRCWLRGLGIGFAIDEQYSIEEQVSLTNGGRPDLVLMGENSFVVVEVKTTSREHTVADTREMQTIHYPREIRRDRFNDRNVTGQVVLLSERGDVPKNEDAVATTFARFALSILEAIELAGVAEAEAYPYYVLASHWIGGASGDIDIRKVVSDLDGATNQQLIVMLATINQLAAQIPMN